MTDTTRTVHGKLEVWTEEGEPGKVFFSRLIGGCVCEIDLARFQFKTTEDAAKLIIKIIDGAAWDSLILSNLVPTQRFDRRMS